MSADFNSLINQLENSLQRSQNLVSQSNQLNRLQTKQLDECQTTMDKSSKNLEDVEHDIDEIEKGFCMRLCCSSKRKKRKSKNIFKEKSEEKIIEYQTDPIYSNDQFQNLDQNLQKLQFFNTLIDQEIQQQIQTLNNLHHRVDLHSDRLIETNLKIKHL